MVSILDDAAARAHVYLSNVGERAVSPRDSAISALSQLEMPLPVARGEPSQTLELVDQVVSRATVASAGPRFFGFVIGGSLAVTSARTGWRAHGIRTPLLAPVCRVSNTSPCVGWNVEWDGLFGAPPITVMAEDEAHPTVLKPLGMLGLGRGRITRVPVDARGRVRPAPCAWCGSVGGIARSGSRRAYRAVRTQLPTGPPFRGGSSGASRR